MQRKFTMAYHIPGTLAANINIRATMPSGATLVHVSAVASNNSDATLDIGESTDTDGYIAADTIGDSNTPTEWDEPSDFDGALSDSQYPHIDNGDILVITLDFDGDGGTAAQNVTIVLTFVEG